MQLESSYAANQAYNYPLLIKQLFITAQNNNKAQEIVYRDQKRMHYADFFQRVEKLGNVLKHLKLRAKQTVAMMDWDSHRYLECFFAIPMSQMVLQTINVRFSNEQIIYALNHAKADVLLIHADFWETYQSIKIHLSTVKKVVWMCDEHEAIPSGCVGEYEQLLSSVSSRCYFPDFDENSRATTFYTTGTTGLPKGVYFSHRQLVLHTLSVTAALGVAVVQGRLHKEDVYMPLTPMSHVHAWGMPYIATMLGLKQVYPGRYAMDHILHLIQKEGVSFTHTVPTILQMLLHHEDANAADLSRLKMIVGGAALPEALAKEAVEKGIDVFAGYGMSETCPVVSFAYLSSADLQTDIDHQIMKRTRTGKPVPLVSVKVADENMHVLGHHGHEIGEIVVRAPWLSQGYLFEKETSEALWKGGWLHTQDLGYIRDDNWLQVTDRQTDVIKSGGEWISTVAIENAIWYFEGVEQVAVFSIGHKKWGERPIAAIVLKDSFCKVNTLETIQKVIQDAIEAGKLSPYGMPDDIVFWDSLPLKGMGKLDKKIAREKYLQERQ